MKKIVNDILIRKGYESVMNQDLTVGNPQTVLWKFCLPMFGSIIFQQLYNIADSLVAGKFIGENALAAVGNSYNVTLVFIAFTSLYFVHSLISISSFIWTKKLSCGALSQQLPFLDIDCLNSLSLTNWINLILV